MWRYNFTKEKTQSKNIVKLKPLELQEEDEAEGPGGAEGGGRGRRGEYKHLLTTNPLTVTPFSIFLVAVFYNWIIPLHPG